jgi:hypothetical protein
VGQAVADHGKTPQDQEHAEKGAGKGHHAPREKRPLDEGVLQRLGDLGENPSSMGFVMVVLPTDQMLEGTSEIAGHFLGTQNSPKAPKKTTLRSR